MLLKRKENTTNVKLNEIQAAPKAAKMCCHIVFI